MLRIGLLALFAVCLTFFSAPAADPPEASVLNTWREALQQFREAARLAHAGKTTEAEAKMQAVADRTRQPYARHAKVLVRPLPDAFAGASSPRDFFRCGERAQAVEQLGEYELTLHWAKMTPGALGYAPEKLAWLLAAAGRHEQALAEYDHAITAAGNARDPFASSDYQLQKLQESKQRIEAMLKEPAIVKWQIEFIRGHFLTGFPHDNKPHRLLTALERLTPLLDQTNEPAERRQIHGQIQACLLGLRDLEGLSAWEDKMLGEIWVSAEDRAGIAAQRAERAHKFQQFAEAEKQWRLICEKFPKTSHYGVAQFNVGYVLQEQGKFQAAIAEYEKLFPSQVNDKDPGTNIMDVYRNYRNRAAKQISQCYDKLGKPREALEWMILARDKYRFESWCGTCSWQEAAATAARLVRLKHKAGDTAEALRDAEAIVFGKEYYAQSIHVPRILAEEYFAQGRAQELLDRVESFRRENLEKWTKEGRRAEPGQPLDGHTDATRLIAGYVEVLQLAETSDLPNLWAWIQARDVPAQHALLPANYQQALAGLAAKRLIRDRAKAVDFLKGRFRTGNNGERAWAAVLLAKLGEVKNPAALERLAAAVDQGLAADLVQTDFLYAALLADPASGKALVDRYLQTALSGPVQNAYYRERNVTLLPLE
jgi:tetratricopeptide (TPR) repeat protein